MEAFALTCSTGAMFHAGTINVVSLEMLNCADRNNACHDIGRNKGVDSFSVSVIHIIYVLFLRRRSWLDHGTWYASSSTIPDI